MKLGIIGFGAIGHTLYKLILQHLPAVEVVGVMDRVEHKQVIEAQLAAASPSTSVLPRMVDTVAALLALRPDLVIECAGHAVLQSAGPAVLRGACDLLVASVGALADAALERVLREAAAASGACIRIPAGALGGLDVLGAARFAGLDSVIYTSNKAPRAWKGTPAEDMIGLDSLTEAQVFYTGDARSAALLFPQNANVAAATALAGIGFEKTLVHLRADPAATGNRHRIQASGAFGEIDVIIFGKTLPENPKTSVLAPYSLIRSLSNLTECIVVA